MTTTASIISVNIHNYHKSIELNIHFSFHCLFTIHRELGRKKLIILQGYVRSDSSYSTEHAPDVRKYSGIMATVIE